MSHNPSRHFCIIVPRSDAVGEFDWPSSGTIGAPPSLVRSGSAAAATVAALVPEDMHVTIWDEAHGAVDPECQAEFIAITANVSQARRAIQLADHFRARGHTVILGGPHVSLAPQLFEGRGDCLVVGEFEAVAERFFADLRVGQLKSRYNDERTDLSSSPKPRWDLYPNDKAMMGVVQTSRGCPFECNFCDVIQYLGRAQRHKPIPNVIAELQALYDHGYSAVTLADDNFTVYRRRVRELLDAIIAWNGKHGRDPIILSTQVSIDLARDEALMRQCVQAGLLNVFVGIETGDPAGLVESQKRQNLHIDIVRECEALTRAGLQIVGGLIVGFDSDDASAFERQFDFAMSLPVAVFAISVLVAPVATPLYQQMKSAGRIVTDSDLADFPSGTLMTNFQPAQMTREQLDAGVRWLISRVFRPDHFLHRLRRIAELIAPTPWAAEGRQPRAPVPTMQRSVAAALRRIARGDPAVGQLLREVRILGDQRPEIRDRLQEMTTHYLISLDGYRRRGIYDPDLALRTRPPVADTALCEAAA